MNHVLVRRIQWMINSEMFIRRIEAAQALLFAAKNACIPFIASAPDAKGYRTGARLADDAVAIRGRAVAPHAVVGAAKNRGTGRIASHIQPSHGAGIDFINADVPIALDDQAVGAVVPNAEATGFHKSTARTENPPVGVAVCSVVKLNRGSIGDRYIVLE